MENSGLKQRLIGAAVLIILAVIFVPMLLDGESPTTITETNIPPKPDGKFSSKIIPLDEITQPVLPETPPAASSATPQPAEIEPAAALSTAPAPAPASAKPQSAPGAWVVQLGSFSSEQNALALRNQLRAKGYTTFVEKTKSGATALYRVNVGPELERARAEAQRDTLEKDMKQKGMVLHHP